jgi:hypothetical protein
MLIDIGLVHKRLLAFMHLALPPGLENTCIFYAKMYLLLVTKDINKINFPCLKYRFGLTLVITGRRRAEHVAGCPKITCTWNGDGGKCPN